MQAERPAYNKWQMQFYDDLQQLEPFDATYWIVDQISPSLHELVENDDIRHAFINFDIKELGQKEICMNMNVHEIDACASAKLTDDDIIEHVCEMLDKEGKMCGAVFFQTNKPLSCISEAQTSIKPTMLRWLT